MNITANVSINNKTVVARLCGELDESSLNGFKDKLAAIIDDYNIYNVIFNLENISFMDSSAIGLIMGRYKQVIRKNGKVVLCGLNEQISKILKISGLLRICYTTKSEDEAKNLLG